MTYGRAMHGMYAPVRTVAPTEDPVTLAEAKAHLRVDGDDEDDLIAVLISAATSELDGWTGILGRALVTQTWTQGFDAFADKLRLPMPAATVSSVTYVDTNGDTQTLASDQYTLRQDALGSYVERAFDVSWPSIRSHTQSVIVTFTCGADADDVPAPLKAAILLRIGDLYANREAAVSGDAVTVNPTIHALVAPYRRIGV
jgi:uncharacterized phiE125 gp8 family phage protein